MAEIVPLAEALASVDSPSAVADRRRRAEEWYKELAAQSGPGRRGIAVDYLERVFYEAGPLVDEALSPFYLNGSLSPTSPTSAWPPSRSSATFTS